MCAMDSDSSEDEARWESADEKFLSDSDDDVIENCSKSAMLEKKITENIDVPNNNYNVELDVDNSIVTDISNFSQTCKSIQKKENNYELKDKQMDGSTFSIKISNLEMENREVSSKDLKPKFVESPIYLGNETSSRLNMPEVSDKKNLEPMSGKIANIELGLQNNFETDGNLTILDGEEEQTWNDEWEPMDSSEIEIKECINLEQLQLTKQIDNTSTKQVESSWGGWSNWSGISTVLSTAATIGSSVSQGLTNVIETGIGVPDPEELAKQHHADKLVSNTLNDTQPEYSSSSDIKILQNNIKGFGFSNLVSGVSQITKLVETTSSKVISGGLDTLETIGKKTMEVLQENDPGLKKKRAFLKVEKPILSHILREAKQKSDHDNIEHQESKTTKRPNYETIFDDYQGLIHLEALEMLSKQCEIQLEILISKCNENMLQELQETFDQVKELCELTDEDEIDMTDIDEIKQKIELAVKEIDIPVSYIKLISTWDNITNILNLPTDENEIHQNAIEVLAQLSAISVEQFHKAGELLLVKQHRSTADEADSLLQLTTNLTAIIGIAATRFSNKLHTMENDDCKDKERINGLITNIFFEAANSSRYIQSAFQLLIPVLQIGAT